MRLGYTRGIRTPTKARSFVAKRYLSSPPITVSPEITQALHENTPVVSLESTIITHGFPFPQNLEMARQVEQVIRQNGCIPATCAFIEGRPYVGLSDQQIEMLAETKGINKVSRRDIGATMAQKLHGGTTIAGTMILSHLAGIKVFATGGLGGVHRDGHITMDVSADLTELGRTPVTVVCAGPKSILDIPRTMEVLETQGVFVGTYNDDGRERVDVPGFFCRSSGVKSPYSFRSWAEMAAIVHNQNSVMGLSSGNLVCVPPPSATALPSDLMEGIIQRANSEAAEKGISGKELTPFLLQKIGIETDGRSVECNRNFVMNNAEAACQIATELAKMEAGRLENGEPNKPEAKITEKSETVAFQPTTALPKKLGISKYASSKSSTTSERVDTLIIGSVALDTVCSFQKSPVMGDSNPGTARCSVGGVGYNVALAHQYALENLESKATSRLVSVVGDDLAGKSILQEMEAAGQDTSGILISESHVGTAQYCASIGPDGELVVACADMAIVESKNFSDHVEKEIHRAKPRIVVVDCNVSPETLDRVLSVCGGLGAKVVVEPTSQPKSARLSRVNSARLGVFPNNTVSMITPTAAELAEIHASFANREFFDDYDEWFPALDSLGLDSSFRDKMASNKHPAMKYMLKEGVLQQAFQLLPYIPNILVKLGAHGCVLVRLSTNVNDYRSVPTASEHVPILLFSRGKEHDEGKNFGVVVEYYDVPPQNRDLAIVNVTGAGDTLVGYISASLANDDWLVSEVETLEREWGKWTAIHRAQLASGKSLESEDAISKEIRTIK